MGNEREALFSASVSSQYVRDHGHDIDMWVRLYRAEAHAAELELKLAAAERSLAEAERDAARYRWLRDTAIEHDWTVCRHPIDRGGVYQQTKKSLDAAIDAAMAREGEE